MPWCFFPFWCNMTWFVQIEQIKQMVMKIIYSGLPGWKRRFGFLSGFRPTNTALHVTKHRKGIQKHLTKATPKKAHLNTLLETNSKSSENSPSFKGMSFSNCYFLRGKRAQPEVMDFSRGGDLRQQAGRNASTARLQSKSVPCVV